MFKCFLFIVFTLYFKGLYTFRLIFDQFHSFRVFNFGNNSVQSDDPSKDKDRNSRNNQPSKPKGSQEQCKNNNEVKSEKDSGKNKNTQTGPGKQPNKKLNTLEDMLAE